MNLLSLVTATVLAAENVFSPVAYPVQKPVLSFANLLEFIHIGDEKDSVPGTGTFSASIIAVEARAPEIRRTKKPAYTIAFLGDSMIDTLGSDLGLVQDELTRMYPSTSFRLLNYGAGGENIVSGLERVITDTFYLGVYRQSLVSQKPDVIVIESFAYNPFPFELGALDHHWLSLAYLVDAVRVNIPDSRIVIAATIAPNSKFFGDGAPGIAFSAADKVERTQTIKRYLENALRFAQSEGLPYADAYHPSLDTNGEGKLVYINPGDHLHYSDAGRQFFAQTVVATIAINKLLDE